MTAPQASALPEDPDLQATLQIEWAKAQEQAKHYEEEVELVIEEMRGTLSFLEWKAEEWLVIFHSFPYLRCFSH